MYRIVFFLITSVLVISCSENKSKPIKVEVALALPYYNEPSFTPIFIEDTITVANRIDHTIADFEFIDQDNQFISEKVIENKIHVASFIFTSCGSICPTMTRNLRTVSKELRAQNDVVFLSYSVTPWIDTPSILKSYKEGHSIKNDNWHFLTGSKSDIYKLARQSYFAEEDIGFSKDSTEFLHTEHLILVDKTKRIRGIYNGTLQLEMKALLDDIDTLQNEAN